MVPGRSVGGGDGAMEECRERDGAREKCRERDGAREECRRRNGAREECRRGDVAMEECGGGGWGDGAREQWRWQSVEPLLNVGIEIE